MRAPVLAALLVLPCLAGPAHGQTPEPLAPQVLPQGSAIFGGADVRGLAARPNRLDLILQVFGGYDDDVLSEQSRGVNQERLASAAGGVSTGLGAALILSRPGLLFKRPGARGDFKLVLDNTFRYYPGIDHLTGRYHRVGLQLSAPLSNRLTLFFSPRADYSPRYAFELLQDPIAGDVGGGIDPGVTTGETILSSSDFDASVVASNSLRYGATGGAELSLGTRTSLTVDAGYTNRRSDAADLAMEVRSAGVGFDHKLTNEASLELGYEYVDGVHGTGFSSTAHNLDIGVDYRKPLSRTRRTFVSFSTGSTVAETEANGRRIQAIGSASLVHHFRRTWTTLVEYRRRVHYVDGFDRPLFGDAITTGVNGLLTRRLELVGRTSYTSGTVGLREDAPRFGSYMASVRVRQALSRRLAGYAEGLYYHYAFDEDAPRPTGLPRTFDRLAFRVGISIWVPVTR